MAHVAIQNNALTTADRRASQSCHASYLPRAYLSTRSAHSNSVDNIASPVNTISQPGPGYGIAMIPTTRTSPPTIPVIIFFARFFIITTFYYTILRTVSSAYVYLQQRLNYLDRAFLRTSLCRSN